MDHFGDESKPGLTWARAKWNELKKCRQRCQLQSQDMITTSTQYPNKLTIPRRRDYCYVLKKISRVCQQPRRRSVLEAAYRQHENLCPLVQTHLVKIDRRGRLMIYVGKKRNSLHFYPSRIREFAASTTLPKEKLEPRPVCC